LVIKGALFEGYQLCHLAREGGKVEPLMEGEFSDALVALGKKPGDFLNEIRDKYDPIRAKKKTSSGGRGSGRSSNNPELAEAPYDPCLCSKRVWNQGLGAQCQSVKMDGSEFCTRCMKEFGNKGALPFGYYDQEKPEEDLVTGKRLPWKTIDDFNDKENKPKMKVCEIRDKLEELGLDTTGKKAEILERLESALEAENQDDEPPVVEDTPKKKKKKMKKKTIHKAVGNPPAEAIETPKPVAVEKPVPVEKPVAVENARPVEKPVAVENARPVEKPVAVENARAVEHIVAKNGQVLNIDLGPVDPAAGTGLIREDLDETIDIEADQEMIASPQTEEDESEDEAEVEDEEDEDADFDVEEYDEIEFEDVDYLYDESSNKVFTMDGIHVGSWDEEEGIKWLETSTVKCIKEANHGD
jgi:hypothetical protein